MENSFDKYPYYIVPLIEEYRRLSSRPERKKLRMRIVANIGDQKMVDSLIGPEENEEKKTGKDSSSFSTIDSFLDKFGGNRAPLGYMMNLEEQSPSDSPKEETASETKSREKEPAEEEIEDNNADIQIKKLIKNRKYKEALQIIERQNLINPSKNIYFADQIRFLRKLVAIENYKNQLKDRRVGLS